MQLPEDTSLEKNDRTVLSYKDERSIVITCSTFVNPESSITDTHSPLMNASPRIRLYLEILSNEILKKDLPEQTGPFVNYIRVIITPQQLPGRRPDVRWARGMESS